MTIESSFVFLKKNLVDLSTSLWGVKRLQEAFIAICIQLLEIQLIAAEISSEDGRIVPSGWGERLPVPVSPKGPVLGLVEVGFVVAESSSSCFWYRQEWWNGQRNQCWRASGNCSHIFEENMAQISIKSTGITPFILLSVALKRLSGAFTSRFQAFLICCFFGLHGVLPHHNGCSTPKSTEAHWPALRMIVA